MLSYHSARPPLEVQSLDEYLSHFKQEDKERDQRMITSADLLELHLSELKDYKETNEPGFYSRRTEELLAKVSIGLLWALDKEGQGEDTQGGYHFLPTRDDFLKAKTNQDRMICINRFLGAQHQNDVGDPLIGNFVIRDLKYESAKTMWQLLTFFSNDLK